MKLSIIIIFHLIGVLGFWGHAMWATALSTYAKDNIL
jgi:hypothetical protein